MPKKTFLKLEEGKRKQVTEAFLREFSVKSFDDASITVVVKELGIAKGSVYQYFEDKLDLFQYLIGECTSVKMKYVGAIDREDFPDYWSFFRELYVRGLQFDAENPLMSNFLHNLEENLRSPSVKTLYQGLLDQVVEGFEKMVQREQEKGLFRDDVPLKTMAFMLYKLGVSIQEQLKALGEINPEESIQNKRPVYAGKEAVLMRTVDDYIKLGRSAFDKS